MGMVFIALAQIAETFGVTLRSASWVVIAQGLTISAFMLPMGRMADIIGRKKVHLIGLVHAYEPIERKPNFWGG